MLQQTDIVQVRSFKEAKTWVAGKWVDPGNIVLPLATVYAIVHDVYGNMVAFEILNPIIGNTSLIWRTDVKNVVFERQADPVTARWFYANQPTPCVKV